MKIVAKSNKAKEIITFVVILQIVNIISFFYELNVLDLSMTQVIFIRSMAIITDVIETYLFIFVDFDITEKISKFLDKRLKVFKKKSFLSGIKLALIGPNIYIFKFFLANFFAIPLIRHYNLIEVDYIDTNNIVIAYATTFILSFIMGVIYYNIENKIVHINFMK